jgi:hypothetical protein
MDTHLTYDISTIRRHVTSSMKCTNRKIKTKHIRWFVNDVITERNHINAFHNAIHTFEVFTVVTHLTKTMADLTTYDKTILQCAALCHDLGHIGLPNDKWPVCYIERQKSYSDKNVHSNIEQTDSYNELMHVELTNDLLNAHKHRLFPTCIWTYALDTIATLIMSTDLKYHAHYLDIIRSNTKIGNMIRVIKIADISHPLRPFHVHVYWVFKIHDEQRRIHRMSLHEIASDSVQFIRTFLLPMLQSENDRAQALKNIDIWSTYLI